MKKTIFIYLAPWNHFKDESGFNIVGFKLKKALKNTHQIYLINDLNIAFQDKIIFKIFKIFKVKLSNLYIWTPYNQYINLYRSYIFLFLSSIFKSKIILLASEDQFCGTFLLHPLLRKKTILFIHQPPSWFINNNIDLTILNDIKTIVVLCKEQKYFFEEKLKRPIILIKHGVDLSSFIHLGIPKKNLVLIVGQHLRDFETIVSTIKKVISLNNKIEFHFVQPVKYRPLILDEIKNIKTVFFHENISTSELVYLYNQAKVTFLPLLDSTANNAINESLACGTPVLTNKVGGVSDYISNDCGIICEGINFEEFSAIILKIIADEITFSNMKIANFAKHYFDWDNIMDKEFISNI